MKTNRYNSLLWLLGLGIFSACSSSESSDTKAVKKPSAQKAVSFKIGEVSQTHVGEQIQLPAEFMAFQEVSIYPKADGFVQRVLVDRGSQVHKGEILMVLEAPETEQRLVAARSNYLKAQAVLVASKEHYRRLKASTRITGSVSALDLESAQAKMMADSASAMGEQANLAALTQIKSYLTVRAPFDGIITERNVHPGALVGAGLKQSGPMLNLQQQDRLRLVVDVPENYSLGLKKGKPVTYHVNAMPGETFKGTISRRSGNMNLKFRSETVEIDVSNTSRRIKPGMFAEVSLMPEATEGALTVPATAVVASTERQYVIRVDSAGNSEFVDVRTGQKSSNLTEVFGNLRKGDKIVVNARNDLRQGVKLTANL
jgi:RND family efflux transporter MFP subunit